ncbi:MAG: ribosome biogenesis GTPase YlqF [Anaeroplasma sp.]
MNENSFRNPINWFPGHMAKAKRELTEKMKLVDLVIELKDARIPYSSTNPMINEIVGAKPRLVLLCKASIADPIITKEWIKHYSDNNILALDIDSVTNYNIQNIIPYANKALKNMFTQREAKGIKNKAIKAMIIGIPNVGKSTLINTLAKRKATQVGDKPGVTKSQTWIRVSPDLLLLDTPGILWPKFEDQTVGIKLAICGSIKDQILDLEFICSEAIKYIKEYYPQNLLKRYNLDYLEEDSFLVLEQIAKNRGCILKGGRIDYTRVCTLFVNELRGMKIGAMSYERPEEGNESL